MRGVDQVAALILAAGGGRRYGQPKALVRFDERLLVDRAAATARAGGCAPVVVVLGAAAEQVRTAAELESATVVTNPAWQTGMGSSLRAGLSWLAAPDAPVVSAALVLLVDLPGITPGAVRRLAAVAAPDVLAVAGYGDRRGHPVVLGRDHWRGASAAAEGDIGARSYLATHHARVRVVACGDIASDDDLDTPPPVQGEAD